MLKWAGKVRPRSITLENVEPVLSWGPLIAKRCPTTGRVIKADNSVARKGEHVPVRNQFLVPDPRRKGRYWSRFVATLHQMGYDVGWRVMSAADFGVPTTRSRLYLVARRDGLPIVFPAPTHGDPTAPATRAGRIKPWRCAADCIDFEAPCPSIFLSTEDAKTYRARRPLADATLRRIAQGIKRYLLTATDPFIVLSPGAARPAGAAHALGVVQANVEALPFLEPIRAAYMEQASTGGMLGRDMRKPLSTIMRSGSQQRLVIGDLRSVKAPVSESARAVYQMLTANLGERDLSELASNLIQDGDDPTSGFVVLPVRGKTYVLSDVGIRMCSPAELAKANGFPIDYVLEYDQHGNPVPQHAQVALVGNSVCPGVLQAIIEANFQGLIAAYERAGVRTRPGRLSWPCALKQAS